MADAPSPAGTPSGGRGLGGRPRRLGTGAEIEAEVEARGLSSMGSPSTAVQVGTSGAGRVLRGRPLGRLAGGSVSLSEFGHSNITVTELSVPRFPTTTPYNESTLAHRLPIFVGSNLMAWMQYGIVDRYAGLDVCLRNDYKAHLIIREVSRLSARKLERPILSYRG